MIDSQQNTTHAWRWPFSSRTIWTSCARGDTICLRPLQVDNIFAFNRQVAPVPAYYLRHQQQVDLWPFELESGVRVTCDVGYGTSVPIFVFLCLSVLKLGPMYARDRQTDRRQTKASLNASALWGWRHNKPVPECRTIVRFDVATDDG